MRNVRDGSLAAEEREMSVRIRLALAWACVKSPLAGSEEKVAEDAAMESLRVTFKPW